MPQNKNGVVAHEEHVILPLRVFRPQERFPSRSTPQHIIL